MLPDIDRMGDPEAKGAAGDVDDLGDQLAKLDVSTFTGVPKSPKKKLDDSLTLESIVEKIQRGKIKNIVTMAGAGISTSAGIPDFR